MRLTRRTLFGLGAASLSAGLVGCSAKDVPHQTARLLPSLLPLPKPFQLPLVLPPVKESAGVVEGVRRYDIVQRAREVEIIPGFQTPILGYDGILPGPTLETRSGEALVVNQRNTLEVPTVTHLHGGVTPADSDGYPIDLVLPEGSDDSESGRGSSDHGHTEHDTEDDHTEHDHVHPAGDISHGHRDYHYPNEQPAATLWYHDHRMDFTAPAVWRGLAGFHLVRDDVEEGLPLPRDERELPLMIMDRAFDAEGGFRYPALDPTMQQTPGVTPDYMSGVLGDVLLVNGVPWPVAEVDAARYRLRLLNASNARRYDLRLDPPPPEGASFTQIGSDAGLLAAPLEHESITVAAAERFDVVVDFSAYPIGTEVVLRNTLGSGSTGQVMKFVVARRASDDSTVPDSLVEVEPLDPGPDPVVREWRFTRSERGAVHGHDGWVINDRLFDPERMDARPRLGEVEVWRFYSDMHHPVHVHLAPFQVRTRGIRGPGPMDHGWKDTVDLRPAEMAEVAIRFSDHAGKYVLHCHNLEHEDMMMMAAFETVD